MAEDNRIRLPSGQGGLTRYFEDVSTKFELAPGAVIIFAIIIIVVLALLHYFGRGFLS